VAGPFLVAYDGSEAASNAVEAAIEQAAALGRRVILVSVIPQAIQHASFTEALLPGINMPVAATPTSFFESARRRLAEVAATAAQGTTVAVETLVRAGDPADEIIRAASEMGAECIVLGYKSFEKRLPYGLGSVADKVVRYADRSVLVLRKPAPSATEPRSAQATVAAGARSEPARPAASPASRQPSRSDPPHPSS
jgi:nucleotide-binding universal stress UspA family protein